VLVFHIV
jgi:hypothetical protein